MRTLFQRLVLLVLLSGTGVAAAQGFADMSAEALLSDSQPFVQQSVILKLRVYHSPGVREIEVEPVYPSGFTLGELDDTPPSTRMIGPRQMATDFYYALMPLSAGAKRVPAFKLRAVANNTSVSANQGGAAVLQSISASSEPVAFEVRPVDAGSESLPPLQALNLKVQFDPRQPARVGQPIRLTIVQDAVGAKGERLPGAAALLEDTDDFRVYPGQSRTTSRLGRNGQMMQGQRIETVTLVPQRAGSLRVPPIRIPWWSINGNGEAEAVWSGLPINVQPAPGTANHESTVTAGLPGRDGLSPPVFTLLLGVVFSFTAGWWLRGRCGRQPSGDPITGRISRLAGRTRDWLLSLWHARMNARAVKKEERRRERQAGFPGRINQFETVRARTAQLAAHLPKPGLLWLETGRLKKHIEAAHDERELRQYLQDYASVVLGLPAQSTLTDLGRVMETAFPRFDVTHIRQLLRDLGASLYGGDEALAIEAWKQAFIDELDRLGRRKPSHAKNTDPAGLPVLNPG